MFNFFKKKRTPETEAMISLLHPEPSQYKETSLAEKIALNPEEYYQKGYSLDDIFKNVADYTFSRMVDVVGSIYLHNQMVKNVLRYADNKEKGVYQKESKDKQDLRETLYELQLHSTTDTPLDYISCFSALTALSNFYYFVNKNNLSYLPAFCAMGNYIFHIVPTDEDRLAVLKSMDRRVAPTQLDEERRLENYHFFMLNLKEELSRFDGELYKNFFANTGKVPFVPGRDSDYLYVYSKLAVDYCHQLSEYYHVPMPKEPPFPEGTEVPTLAN